MAIYTSTLVTENIYGGNENVTISQTSASLNQLLKSTGDQKLVLRSLNIWSLCPEQVREVLSITKSSIDGISKTSNKVPQLDAYQANFTLNDIKLGDLQYDENIKFSYKIKANCNVKITLNIDPCTLRALSKPAKFLEELDEDVDSFLYGVKPKMGMKEKEEIVIKPTSPSMFKEREETCLNVPSLYTEEKNELISDAKSILESPDVNKELKPFLKSEMAELQKIVKSTKEDKNITKEQKANKLRRNIKKAKVLKKKIEKKKKIFGKEEKSIFIGVLTAGVLFGYILNKIK